VAAIKAVLPSMRQRRSGYIINTASFAGLYPYAANRIPYVAAKAAVIAMSESLALYLHPKGVRVSCFCPGPVATGVMNSMKTWSSNVAFRGPGSQYEVIAAEDAAVILADGMRDGRVIIPTDPKVWDVIRRHAASPDSFIQEKIDEMYRPENVMAKLLEGMESDAEVTQIEEKKEEELLISAEEAYIRAEQKALMKQHLAS